jgi:hypothetical protein
VRLAAELLKEFCFEIEAHGIAEKLSGLIITIRPRLNVSLQMSFLALRHMPKILSAALAR